MVNFFANEYGNGVIYCTSTVSGARYSGAGPEGSSDNLPIDVALGKPMLDSLADIASFFDIKKSELFNANGQLAVTLWDGESTTYDLSKTWAQQGLREGDSVVLGSA